MKTTNNIINSIMKNLVKYLCAVLMIIGTSAHAWGTTYTRVTSWDQLSNGDIVILANTGTNGSAFVMTSTMDNGVRYQATSATISSGTITTTSAMEMRIKFNNDKTWCGFCIGEVTGAYPTTTWLQDNGTNNQISSYEVSRSFDNMSDFTGPGNKYWSWQCNAFEGSAKNYKVNLANARTSCGRSLQYYSGSGDGMFASHTTANPCLCAIFKKSCSSPFGTLAVAGGATVTWSGST